ncbi:DUF1826 domain-containing protein [Azospirillum halopraeferens]|uniref:DUF1826 domain-containing protein n=1 Tax=Azospirillum halopraeferens TaxID=34010 RepID=UPI0004220895|nr:DUF1826 domain-containing protein [Azospirillum halopraeferens]
MERIDLMERPPAGGAEHPAGGGHVVRCRAAGHLRAIAGPGVTLAIRERALPAAVASGIAAVRALSAVGAGFETTAARVRADLPGAVTAADAADRAALAPLLRDVALLVRCFAGITGAARVTVRLEAVTGNGCRYFHADHVGIRLLCTYRGAGTLWLPDDAVNRAAPGSGDNDAIVRNPGRIRALAPGHVALLKGEAWPGNRGRGIVHRSPPADPRRGPRLLLCLDHERD